MKQRNQKRRISALFTCLFLVATLVVLALPAAAAPKHTDYISDPDSYLSETTVSAIKTANEALFKDKEVRIAVCVVAGTGNDTIANYTRNLFTDWNMCDGVLLLVDTQTPDYYAVQSVDIDDILTNTILEELLTQYMEAEFDAGNYDKAVMKTFTALAQFLNTNLSSLTTAEPTAPETDENGEEVPAEEEPAAFVKFMKAVLWIILVVILLVLVLFIAAMFNDDLGDFIRTYIFRKSPTPQAPLNDYYDDRLYSQPRRNPNNPYGQMNRQRQNGYDPYNDYNQQYRQPQPRQGQRPQGQRPAQGQRPYPQNQNRGYNQYPNQNQGYGTPRQGYNQQGYPQQGYQSNRPRQGQPNPYQTQGTGRQNPNGNRRPPNNQGY